MGSLFLFNNMYSTTTMSIHFPYKGIELGKFPISEDIWISSTWRNYLLFPMVFPCFYLLVLGYRQIRLSMWFIAFCAGIYMLEIVQTTGQMFDMPKDWICFIIALGCGFFF